MQQLKQARREDTERRVNDDNLAILEVVRNASNEPVGVDYDDELRRWIEAFMPPLVQDPTTGQQVIDESQWSDQQLAKFYEVAELVVRHDVLRELRERLFAQIPVVEKTNTAVRREDAAEEAAGEARTQPLSAQAHDAARRRQEEIDLYSVAILMLDDEKENLRHAVQQEYDYLAAQR